MLEEYKYKTEIHAHTRPASVCSQITPEHMVEVYLENGYDSVTITNHLCYDKEDPEEKIKRCLEDYYKTAEIGKKSGLNVILGSEIRFAQDMNDYLVYGIGEQDLYEINSLLEAGIENFYKTFRNDKNVIFQAHPFRDGMVLADKDSIDGIEVFNLHPGHNSRIGFAAKYARENDFIITAGSDFHHFGHEAMCAILTKEPLENSYQLAAVLKARDYVIGISGYKVLPC